MEFFLLDFRTVSIYAQYFFPDACYLLVPFILLGFDHPNNTSRGVKVMVLLIPQLSPACCMSLLGPNKTCFFYETLSACGISEGLYNTYLL